MDHPSTCRTNQYPPRGLPDGWRHETCAGTDMFCMVEMLVVFAMMGVYVAQSCATESSQGLSMPSNQT
eukprot:10745782-Prorocentrum_lima.AAC.1